MCVIVAFLQANSVVFAEVRAPDWLHKYIIGKKGITIRNITANFPKVRQLFLPQSLFILNCKMKTLDMWFHQMK